MSDRLANAIEGVCEAFVALPPTDAPSQDMLKRGIDRGKYDETRPIREKLTEVVQFLEPFRKRDANATLAGMPRPLADSIIGKLQMLKGITDEIPRMCQRPVGGSAGAPQQVPPSYSGQEMSVAHKVEAIHAQLYSELAPLLSRTAPRPGHLPPTVRSIELSIAYVLFIDVADYSKLLNEQQTTLVDTLNRLVRGTAKFRSADADGRLIKIPTGDGMALVFYGSPEEPVECALEISEALGDHSELPLRMGIHSGPVNAVIDVNDRPNVTGAGINLAQRVMDCGDAGHILLSKHIAEDLEHYSKWKPHLHDVGEFEVKHGRRLFIVNLYTGKVGNPNLPKKYSEPAGTDAPKPFRTIPEPLLASQLDELRELQGFLGGKEESELWELFDLHNITRFNIRRARAVIDSGALTPNDTSEIDAFFKEGQAILSANYCKVTRTAGGFTTEPVPGKLGILNLSKKYVINRRMLAKFQSSPQLPLAITNAIKDLDQAVADNAQLLLDVINQKLAENPARILREEDGGSPLFGATSGAFLDKCVRLKPKQTKVMSEIRRYLNTE